MIDHFVFLIDLEALFLLQLFDQGLDVGVGELISQGRFQMAEQSCLAFWAVGEIFAEVFEGAVEERF